MTSPQLCFDGQLFLSEASLRYCYDETFWTFQSLGASPFDYKIKWLFCNCREAGERVKEQVERTLALNKLSVMNARSLAESEELIQNGRVSDIYHSTACVNAH